ncbi:ABC transporter ATP-binding protein [Natrinema salaciae]|uniref:Amino acid/amide ABC transporter ATP-binding protein 2, HAAT family n=1 Tax=Natrinema salaciae TaxID=1186196 RepID=A0A1H9A0I9_9EURY|nr:ABC transporter ATP-binding protein [Natrinema salaciae]SEP70115.1 amino acid/amide ABC transporter ATP-binding protein 2, HAAT family [Natrinema salaciae]
MSLEITDLSAGYDGTPILRDVDCRIDESEIVGIMGKNGVGKTTLLKTVMGLLEPDTGSVRYRGEDITGRSADERASLGVGYVPQGRDVFPGLTVEENLLIGENVGSGDATLYDRVYEYFPILEDRATQDADTMSGGQQQMLAIGRALVGDPDLLLVDEPSEGVQPSIVQSITADLARINEDLGTTILFVEQNLSVIQTLADRCYAMDKGRIVNELDETDLDDREQLTAHLVV